MADKPATAWSPGRHGRRPRGVREAKRLHREGRLVGREDHPEDRAHPGARQRLQVPMIYLGGRGGRAHLGADQDLPGLSTRAAYSTTRSLSAGGAAGVRALRPVRPPAPPTSARSHDCVIMVDGKASLYVGSPEWSRWTIGRRRHSRAGRSPDALHGVGMRRRARASSTRRRSRSARRYLSYCPALSASGPPRSSRSARSGPVHRGDSPTTSVSGSDMYEVIDRVVDAGSFFEIKRLFAPEDHRGLRAPRGRRWRGRQPAQGKGGVLMVGFLRQGGAVHRALQRLQRPAPVPGRVPAHGRP